MSTTKRLISGTAASWGRILITVLSQIILLPIFLTYWDVKLYGIWIAIQAVVSVFSTFDRGFNDYLEYSFLKLGIEKKDDIKFKLWSGFIVIIIMTFIECVAMYLVIYCGIISYLFEEINSNELNLLEVQKALLLQWIGWSMTNIVGLFFRSLCPFGYFPRMAWWNVLLALSGAAFSLIGVISGGNIWTVTLYYFYGIILILLFQLFDIRKNMIQHGLTYETLSVNVGINMYIKSLGLSCRYFLDNFKQQGMRIILIPLLGTSGITTFTTMRTISNIVLQGLQTVTHPMLPELMRFINKKEQQKIDASFSTVWFLVVFLLSPGVIILQLVSPKLFSIWTKNAITFDPAFFALVSSSVLVYALIQPAMAICVGNNQIKSQVYISGISAFTLILSLITIVPKYGLIGAGMSLLISEISSAILIVTIAKSWLQNHHILWPNNLFNIVLRSVLFTIVCSSLIAIFTSFKIYIFCGTILLLIFNIIIYWEAMPDIVTKKVYNFIIPKIFKLTQKY